jgi:hypothetical protein
VGRRPDVQFPAGNRGHGCRGVGAREPEVIASVASESAVLGGLFYPAGPRPAANEKNPATASRGGVL